VAPSLGACAILGVNYGGSVGRTSLKWQRLSFVPSAKTDQVSSRLQELENYRCSSNNVSCYLACNHRVIKTSPDLVTRNLDFWVYYYKDNITQLSGLQDTYLEYSG